MGIEMELELEKIYRVGRSPKTVLVPSHRHRLPSIRKRNSNSINTPDRRDDLLKVNEDFLEINFSRFRSVSCKSAPSRPSGNLGKVELKRTSVYHSSRDVRKTKNMGATDRRKIEMRSAGMVEERKKIEIPRDSDMNSSMSIVDSLCSSDEGSSRKRSSSVVSFMSSPSLGIAESSGGDLKENVKFRCDEIVSRVNDGNGIRENEMVRLFPKSLSANLQLPHSPSRLETGRDSSKVRVSPIRKMFDPLVKSKSLWNPSVHTQECRELRTMEIPNWMRGRSSPVDVLSAEKNCNVETRVPEANSTNSAVASSPVHLHGILRKGARDKQGDPYFDFSVKGSEDVFLAKIWKEKSSCSSAFNRVYTFHSLNSRKRSAGSGWDSSEKDSTVVGQMQVSCYLHSQLKSNGRFHNSLVTESILHDIAQARRSSAQDRSISSTDIRSPQSSSSGSAGHVDLDSVSSPPLKSGDPHPDLEIAAVVIEVPCEKRERFPGCGLEGKVTAVLPSGSHGLPESDSLGPVAGPSSLLDRWRSGGGCDCGGWDMGCPLTVLCGASDRQPEDQKLVETKKQRSLELYFQGSKEVNPAVSISSAEEGHYVVDFHARLSSLQAFSICVAMLHGSKVSISSGPDGKELSQSQCNSLKTLIEEEVKNLIEVVAEDKCILKKVKDVPTSYALNPPFSPIARV